MSSAARKPTSDPALRGAIAKVKIACKELAIDDDTYRAIMVRITGQRSAADCSVQQLGIVIDELKVKGWKPAVFVNRGNKQTGPTPRQPVVNNKRAPADSPIAKKARAMWISLWQLGAVHDSGERALEAFARRQLGVEAMQWADQGLAYKLIEALKAWAEREGWAQGDMEGIPGAERVERLKRRLLIAQAVKLGRPGSQWVWDLPASQIDIQIARFGREIHEARG